MNNANCLFLAACAVLLAPCLHGQILVENSAGVDIDGSTNSAFAFDTGSNGDRALIVFVQARQFNPAFTPSVTSLQYDGQNLISLGSVSNTADSNAEVSVQMFYLLNPASGSNSLSYDIQDTTRGISLGVVGLSAVEQSAPTIFGSSNASNGTSSSNTVSLTTTANNSLIVSGFAARDTNVTGTGFSSTTTQPSGSPNDSGSGTSQLAGAFGTQLVSTAGNTDVTWSWTSGAEANAQFAVAFAPIPEPGTAVLALSGLGMILAFGRRRRR